MIRNATPLMKQLILDKSFTAQIVKYCVILAVLAFPSKSNSQSTVHDTLAIIKNTIIDVQDFSGSWGMRELSNVTEINDTLVLGLFSQNNNSYNLYSFVNGSRSNWKLEISNWGRYGRTVGRVFKTAGLIHVLTFTKDTFFILEITKIQSKFELEEIASYPLHSLEWRHQVTFDTGNSTWMLHLGYYDKNVQYVDSVKVIRIKGHDAKTIYTYRVPFGGFSNPFATAMNKDQVMFTFDSDTLFILFNDSLNAISISSGPIYAIIHFDSIDKQRVFTFILQNTFTYSKSFVVNESSKNIQYTNHLSIRSLSRTGCTNKDKNLWYMKTNGDSVKIFNFSDTFGKSPLKTVVFRKKNLLDQPYFENDYLIINSLYGDTFISSAFNPAEKSFDSLLLDGPIGKIIPCKCGYLVITRKHSTQIFGKSYFPKSLFLIDSSGSKAKILDLTNSLLSVWSNYPRIYTQMNSFVYFTAGQFGNLYYSSLSSDSICKSNIPNATVEFSLYPNPGQDRLYSNTDVAKLSVFNSLGQKMPINIQVDDQDRKYLNLVNYPKGFYSIGFENTYKKFLHE